MVIEPSVAVEDQFAIKLGPTEPRTFQKRKIGSELKQMSKRIEKMKTAETPMKSSAAKPVSAAELAATIRKSGLVGMWKDRTDISDSGKFARTLRKRASTRKPE